MSTDQQLPAIKLTSLKVKLPLPPTQPDSTSDESFTAQFDQPDECQTPKSPAHKMPAIGTCPPAPKKQRRSSPSCKRKISEFEFFEIVARDEIEAFFKSSYEFVNRNPSSKIRRCIPL